MKLSAILAACAFACVVIGVSQAEAKSRRVVQAEVCNGPDIMRPCFVVPAAETNFLAGVRSISVTMKREKVGRHRTARATRAVHQDSFTDTSLVDRARAYMGQTASQIGLRRSQWCSAFIRHLTNAAGVDDRAISWMAKPKVGPTVGSIAVMRHHVGVVSGFDERGNPIIVSGNHGRRVGEGTYARSRVLAFVSAS